MKSIILTKPGLENELTYIEMPMPHAGQGEVVVKVKAFSINPVDIKTRKGGAMYKRIQDDGPAILGWDIAGVVSAVGEGVTAYKVGDRVFGMVNFPGHGRAYAEFVAAPASHLALQPKNIGFEGAAASTLAALTAYQVLKKYVKSGDTVLIQAAAGGVGHFAVQIAKILGAKTIGVASGKNETFLKSLGLDKFIDYTKKDFTTEIDEVNFALDSQGGDVLLNSIKKVKSGGSVIAIATTMTPEIKDLASKRNVSVDFQLVESNGEDMQQIALWLESGQIKPHIDKVYGFDEIESAHQHILSGHTRGKVVVQTPTAGNIAL